MNNRPSAITKVLSLNDTGETGGHQAGILVPKNSDVLSFFPDLGNKEKNPRVSLYFLDDAGYQWKFNFIYYNNRFFDENGTRNEYRLTGMTAYFRENGLKAGDAIILKRDDDGEEHIQYRRNNSVSVQETVTAEGKTVKKLKLGTNWKVIDY